MAELDGEVIFVPSMQKTKDSVIVPLGQQTSKLLGHINVHTTEIYADVVMETKVASVNLVNGLFDKKPGQKSQRKI